MTASLKSQSLYSVVENVINSATSFIISAFLIKITSPEEYGKFNIVFISVTLALAVGTALFNNQIALFSAKKYGDERSSIVSTLSISYYVLSFIFSVVLYIVIDLTLSWGFGVYISTYAFLYNIRENCKTVLYLNGLSYHAAKSTMYLLVLSLFSCSVFYFNVIDFNMPYFMALISVSYLAPVYLMTKYNPLRISLQLFDRRILLDNINHSKWSLAAGIAAWGQSNIYAYVIAYFQGAVLVGYLYATRLLMMPLNVLITGVFSGIKSQLSFDYEINYTLVRRKVFSLYFFMALGVVLYSLLCWYFWDYLDKYLFSGKYREVGYLVLCWGTYFACQSIRVGVTNFLQLGLYFKKIGVISIPIYVLSIFAVLISAKYQPYYYSIFVMSFFELIMFFMLIGRAKKCP